MKDKKRTLLKSIIALVLCVAMLIGTTYAWFTDSVESGINTIAAGNLDVELYHSNAAVQNKKVDASTELFMDLNGKDILWEPGVVSYENLRVVNEGDLALAYQLALNTANENYIVDPATGAQYGLSQVLQVGVVEGGITATDRDGVVASVATANWTTLANFLRSGSLLPEGAGESEKTWGVVIYWKPGVNDNFWNLNNSKTLNEGDALTIDLGVKLIATQEINELDNFGNEYDANAKAEFFAGFQGGSAGAAVTADDAGLTTAEVAMAGGDVSAVIPAGVQVAAGTNSLALSVALKESSEANIQLSASEEMRPLDVHIEGVAQGNAVPMLITLKHYLTTGINTGALRLYHVENGTPVAMTQVAAPANHNEFSYDPLTGDVTLALASFSEVAVVADTNNPWNGETETPYSGSGTEADPYLIANADQLAYFRTQVDNGNTFEGKYVKLNNNIYLSGKNFDPIGWGYEYNDWNAGDVAGKPFKGTFDGNGKTIFDLYQQGWELEAANGTDYTYTNCGFGLFAAAADATFKNLTIYGADIKTECVEMGVLVGLSQGNCTYENINIHNSKIANYQRPTGGLIGEVSPLNGGGTTKITNVVIGADVVVGSLWGDFDAPCGGVIGARWDDSNTTKVNMTDVKVHCQMDVYSDVTSAYQWYAYRRAGMLIGNTEQVAPYDAHLAYADFLKCDNVEVCYGDWAAYHYCQFTNQDNTWANNYPWVRVEAGENCEAYSNPRYGQPVINGVAVSTDTHTCTAEHKMELRFNQLYGGGQGVYGQPAHDGVDVVDCRYTITYMNNGEVLSVKYVTEAGAVSTNNAPAQHLVELWGRDNIDYVWKFGGWMTAASAVIENIPADNENDIVLYPYYQGVYTATFVNQAGEVLAWELFAQGATSLTNVPANPELDDFEFDYWEIRQYKSDGTYTNYGKMNETNLAKVKSDITLYPYYKYNGDVSLIPVDSNADGETDYYQVGGFGAAGVQTVVEIPGDVNGKKVTEINAGAFGEYDGLHVVVIPANIESIGNKAISDQNAGYSKQETVSIYYEGSYAEWQAKGYGQGWITGLSEDTRIFFLNHGDSVDSGTYLQVKHKKTLGYITGYSLEVKTNASALVGEYYKNCDCKVDGCKGNLRPDAHYWEALKTN